MASVADNVNVNRINKHQITSVFSAEKLNGNIAKPLLCVRLFKLQIMKKTAIRQIIERLEDAQNHIIANTDYATGYYGALSDAITVCESFLEQEKEQIIYCNKKGWFASEFDFKFYENTFSESNQADA